MDFVSRRFGSVSYTHLDVYKRQDHNTPHDSGEFDHSLRIFTLRGLVAFFAVFGWSGLVMLKGGLGTVVSIFLALVSVSYTHLRRRQKPPLHPVLDGVGFQPRQGSYLRQHQPPAQKHGGNEPVSAFGTQGFRLDGGTGQVMSHFFTFFPEKSTNSFENS